MPTISCPKELFTESTYYMHVIYLHVSYCVKLKYQTKIHFLLDCGQSFKRNPKERHKPWNSRGKKCKKAKKMQGKGDYPLTIVVMRMTFHLCVLALCSLPVSHTKHSRGKKLPALYKSLQHWMWSTTYNLQPPTPKAKSFWPSNPTFQLSYLTSRVIYWYEEDSFPPLHMYSTD